ncbi:HD domain-containing protein [Limibacter armeniacum]|uniref:HD domain-containing protein n=1 Tax=Limibacter armeniacum TaxID=466084 RepID=UPI002FE53F45
MLKQEVYQRAIKFAGEKHCDQLVPGTTANYLLHLSNVAMEVMVAYQNEANFEINTAVQLALLHDVLEDTKTSESELVELFGDEIGVGVKALTKDDDILDKQEKMADSLRRIKKSYKEVSLVKLADRITNLQQPPKHWNTEKIKKYWEEATLIHQELSGFNKFLDQRLAAKISEYQKYWSEDTL